jgi:hypothetical protein
MDLITLEKNAILVPTPGQTEQEYLAQYLSKENLFQNQNQKNFSISIAQKQSEHFVKLSYIKRENNWESVFQIFK